MKKTHLLLFCVISISLCYATPSCHELQQSQLASLNERMTQMINSLYTSPIAAKAHFPPPLSSSNATPSDCPYDTAYYSYPYPYAGPQVIYVTPPVSYPPPIPNVPIAPKPTYYPYIPEYPETGLKPTWSSYYDPPYPVPPPAYPTPIPYPPPTQPPVASFPPPPLPPYPPTPYPPTAYPPTYPSPPPYPPFPAYPYSWDSFPEYPKPALPPQGYPAAIPPYPYPRQPEIPPPMPYYA